MKRSLVRAGAAAGIFGMLLLSCGKDQPLTSEANEVTTTADGLRYAVDTMNSNIEWRGYKVVKTDNTSHFGTIKFESGEVTVKDGQLESGKFVADMNSVTSVDLKDDAEQQAKLTGHLKSEDFFGTEQFPNASFEITKVTPNTTGDYNTTIEGNLTMKGITKPVVFNANVTVDNDAVTIASEPKDISRKQFGVNFDMPAANGLIKDEVTIQMMVKALSRN
ncbi:MAG: YceI family protein [Chryseobacterium sp.]|nr:MAG: YceI family protein [Chryseobacterium sp.]